MAHASTAAAGLTIRTPHIIRVPHVIRMPHVAVPKWRWPSPRTRALRMLALMFSPAVLSDAIGYCVQRIFYTANQLEERQPTDALLSKIRMFDVACPASHASPQERGQWASYGVEQGWPLYPPAGPGCFRPTRNLRGIAPLAVFTVACPQTLLSAVEHRRWSAYAADHKWGAYPQAGAGCVDP